MKVIIDVTCIVPIKHLFYCPACECYHWFTEDRWTWNKDYEKPTIRASILTKSDKIKICHVYVTDGKIQFLGDCTHEFAGKTVEMEEV
jgi:Family of unknown function (DUF6527)